MPEDQAKPGWLEAAFSKEGDVITVGIDPGKTGAMVILYPDNSVQVHRVPLTKLRGKEQPAWVSWKVSWENALKYAEPDMIVIEDVAARPGQGVTSMFNFGKTLGFVNAIALGRCPVHYVTPTVWKGKMGLLKSDKNASREMVRRLLPSITSEVERVKDDGVAEAALLTYYGRKYLA